MGSVIVVSVDGRQGEGHVLSYVSRLAREIEASVRLLLVRPPLSVVVSGRGVLDRVARREARRRAAARIYLDRFAGRLEADGVRVDTEMRFGAGGPTLVQVIRETGAQVVIAPSSYLPVWRSLPAWTHWGLPSLVGVPILAGALRRHALTVPRRTDSS